MNPNNPLKQYFRQPAGRVHAPFFGRPPSLNGNLGKMVRLASATGARIVPVYAERRPGAHFVLHALPAMRVTADGRDRQALLDAVVKLDALLDPIVRKYSEQWYMAVEFGDDPADGLSLGPFSAAPHTDR